MSVLPPSNAFLVLTRFATFLLRVRIRSYMNTPLERVNSAGAAWRSCLLRMEWSGLPVWWAEREEWLWRNTATGWCQATTAMRMVAATRPFRYTLGWALFLLLSVFDCMAMESQCCLVCKYYNDSQCIATSPLELLFFISFLTQIFFYFSFDATLLHRISYFGCSKHHVQFSLTLHVVTIILVCFTFVVPFLCILPLFWLSC